jgi:ABC-2 type transport system permease protein
MIAHQLTLMRRELWEHRSIWITPAAIGVVVSLLVMAMLVFASGFAKELDVAIFGAQNLAGEEQRSIALIMHFLGTSWIFLIALAILTVFYCLDSLYAERKDKSILFWRSLPVTDAETVLSKLLTAVFVIPLITCAGIFVTHLVNLIVTSIWVSTKGGSAGTLIWSSLPIIDIWLFTFIVVISSAIWMSPFVGWFLLVSAWTKRMPLLVAFMPIIVIPLLEWIVFRTRFFASAVGERGDNLPIFHIGDIEMLFEGDEWLRNIPDVQLLDLIDIGKFVTHYETWIGIIVCGLLATAAIYVRRYRDES